MWERIEYYNKKCILSIKNREFGEGVENAYFDPDQRMAFKVNFQSLTAETLKEVPPAEGDIIEPIRSELSGLLKKSIPAKFKDANVLVLSFTKGLQMTLDITIVASAINMKNKFTGEWISTWQFVWEKDSTVGKLSGEIKVVGHFFEEGNIQRKVSQKHKEEEVKIEGSIAKNIMDHIDSDDTKIRAAIEDMEGEFTEELLKKIRRKLPG